MQNNFNKARYKKNLRSLKSYFDVYTKDDVENSPYDLDEDCPGLYSYIRDSYLESDINSGIIEAQVWSGKVQQTSLYFPISYGTGEENLTGKMLAKTFATFVNACKDVFGFQRVFGPYYLSHLEFTYPLKDYSEIVKKFPLKAKGLSETFAGEGTIYYACEDEYGFFWEIELCLRYEHEDAHPDDEAENRLMHMVELTKFTKGKKRPKRKRRPKLK